MPLPGYILMEIGNSMNNSDVRRLEVLTTLTDFCSESLSKKSSSSSIELCHAPKTRDIANLCDLDIYITRLDLLYWVKKNKVECYSEGRGKDSRWWCRGDKEMHHIDEG